VKTGWAATVLGGVMKCIASGLGDESGQGHRTIAVFGNTLALKESRVATKEKKDEGAQFVRYFGPLLNALRGLGGSAKADEAVDRVAEDLKVPDEVLNETLPSGGSRFRNQVAWARFYLVREGLIDSSKHGVWSLTEQGFKTELSAEKARQLFLKWVKIFQEQRKQKEQDELVAERVAEGTGAVSKDYREEVLDLLLAIPPAGFERLSQRLLREAGFTQVVVTGQSGDGGIDGFGILQVNPLVSFKVLFQCKRYAKSVAPSQVRDFRGAMSGRADKGIIITTGTFTAEARREATRDGAPPIELIDGEKLIDMLEKLELGLRSVTTFEVEHSFFKEFNA
jgi:restriction system protein